MAPLKRLKQFFHWLLGLHAIEEKVEHIAQEQAVMKGDVRQMQQKADSLRHLVEQMRRREDWFHE